MKELSKTDAQSAALTFLIKKSLEKKYKAILDKNFEHPRYYIFMLELTTQNINDLIPGVGPIAISKTNGQICEIGSHPNAIENFIKTN